MRGPFILLAAALLTTGCIGGPDDDAAPASVGGVAPIDVAELSQPVFELAGMVETFIETHDGVRLHTAEYHPDVADGVRTPVVIQFSPYFGNLDSEANNAFDDYWVELLVSRGYTVVYASVRGTGYSGGCYQLGGPAEVQDAHDLVTHYHEAEWSNGNVGMIGVSYPGTTPWMAAATNPPGLRTIVPIEGISDMYRYMYVNGASYYAFGPLFPTYYRATVDWALAPANAGGLEHVMPVPEAACPDVAEHTLKGVQTMRDGDHDAFWDARDYEQAARNTTAAVFLVQGLQDWNVDPDNGVPIFNDLPEPKKLWLGQWAHNVPYRNSYNSDWDRHDWNVTLVAWFDQFLKGHDTGVLDEPPVLVQDSAGHWHREQAWPPDGTDTLTLYLGPEGRLSEAPTPDAGAATMGPARETVTHGVDSTPTDALVETLGPDHLRFVSDPVPRDTLITGMPRLALNMSIDAEGGHLVADLYDVDERAWLGHAIVDLAHRNGRDAGEPVTPNAPFELVVEFFPLEAFVPEGHRIGLVLMPEDTNWIYPSEHRPVHTVELDAETPSMIHLDILPSPEFEEAPQQGDVAWSE